MASTGGVRGGVGGGCSNGGMTGPAARSVLPGDHPDDPVVRVLGAPGTGKTTLAVGVAVDRVRSGAVAADRLLVLSPTRRSAARLRELVTTSLGATTSRPLAMTPSALAFAVLREAAVRDGGPPPRLITGPEQDVVLRELLAGHREGEGTAPAWPDWLRPALPTRGFRDQLRDLLMRAVEHGLGPRELAGAGRRHDRPEWVAAARVLEEYDQVTALQRPGAYDPAWIATAAADLLEDDEGLLAEARARVGLLVVDDAQDLTASAARLVEVLHHPGLPVWLLGDPDVTSQAFRGADPGRLDRLADRLGDHAGSPARTLVLEHRLRQGRELAAVTARVSARIGTSAGVAHRRAEPVRDGGSCTVRTLRSPAQEAAFVAGWLRRAHLDGGVAWSDMAVLARSNARLDLLRRSLVAAGVPVRETGLTGALREQPAVRHLLLAFGLVTDAPGTDPDPDTVVDLLSGPFGGVGPADLRRLRRIAREHEGHTGGGRPADRVLADLVLAPATALPVLQDHPAATGVTRLGRVLGAGREAASRRGATAEEVLWALWDASGLAPVWRDQALAGGTGGARADRDLDAVMVLFGAASDYVERLPGRAPDGFLDHVRGQDLAADTLVDRARPADVVEVLTPAGAAGRGWSHVAVVGVQEGVWPDLRRRDSLLGAEALVALLHDRPVAGAEGTRAAQAQVRADETRQFHLAVTRAAEALLVTAVASTDEQPSPFLTVLDPGAATAEPVLVPPEPTLRGLVGELRRELVSAHRAGDQPRRDRAARHLARLARAGVPGADPGRWWGAREVSGDRPLQPEGPVLVSPSRVAAFQQCPLRWLLTSRGGEPGEQVGASVGTLVHDIAAEHPESPEEELLEVLDQRWPSLGLEPGWVTTRQRDGARDMLRRYARYVADLPASGRRLESVETSLDVTVGSARVTGRVDRLERDGAGRVVVVDLKTGSGKPTAAEVGRHPQLGVYQAALRADGEEPGGAALVHLGKAGGKHAAAVQQQPALAEDPDPSWAFDLLQDTAAGMGGSGFPAVTGPWCRTCPVVQSCPAQPEGAVLA